MLAELIEAHSTMVGMVRKLRLPIVERRRDGWEEGPVSWVGGADDRRRRERIRIPREAEE